MDEPTLTDEVLSRLSHRVRLWRAEFLPIITALRVSREDLAVETEALELAARNAKAQRTVINRLTDELHASEDAVERLRGERNG